jgi:hypothetical protein
MFELLQNPGDCYNHIRRYSTAVILASVFGQRGARFESPKVQALYHAQEQFTEILAPGATPPVDAFPFLKYLPAFMSGWRVRAKQVKQEQSSLYLKLLQETKDRIGQNNKTTPCFLERVLKEQEKSGLDDVHVAYLGGNLVRTMSQPSASTRSRRGMLSRSG